MAFSSGSANGGSGGFGRRLRGNPTLSEINIVPLVDVVLVLLIIFMLTAHVMEFGLEIDVPQVRQVKDTAEDLPVIGITRDARIYLNGKPENINELVPEIHRQFKDVKKVYVMASKDVTWDPIMQVIAIVGEDAKLQVQVVTKPLESTPRPRR